MRTLLLFFVFAVAAAWAQNTPPEAAAVIACAGTPGNTRGNYRQQCQTSAGAIYACNNAAGCTVAADWVAVAGNVAIPASQPLLGSNSSSALIAGTPPTGQWSAVLITTGGLAAETINSLFVNRLNRTVTVQEVWCQTDVGTISLNLQDGGANIPTSPLTCNATGVATTTLTTTSIAQADTISYISSSPASTPVRLTVAMRYQ